MSDIITKLLLGTSIGAVTMMFVMAAGIDFSNDANVTELSFPIMGHATVMAIHPDGSAQYAQGDNEIMAAGKDIAAKELYSNTRTGAFLCVGAGTQPDATVVTTTQLLTSALATTLVVCDASGGTQTVPGTDASGTNVSNERTVAAEITIIDGTQTLTEVSLSNAGGGGLMSANAFRDGTISHVNLANDVDVVEGTKVTITFTMSTG